MRDSGATFSHIAISKRRKLDSHTHTRLRKVHGAQLAMLDMDVHRRLLKEKHTTDRAFVASIIEDERRIGKSDYDYR